VKKAILSGISQEYSKGGVGGRGTAARRTFTKVLSLCAYRERGEGGVECAAKRDFHRDDNVVVGVPAPGQKNSTRGLPTGNEK